MSLYLGSSLEFVLLWSHHPEQVPLPNSENTITTKDLIHSREKDLLSNFSVCTKSLLYPVFCDFYDPVKIKSNGLTPDVLIIDFTFNL